MLPVLGLGSHGAAVVQLQESLADLGYLPVRRAGSGKTDWVWRFQDIPAPLRQLWQPGVYTAMTAGAVMAFEADHGLAVDGLAGPKVSAALATALRNRQKHTRGYSWVYVSTSNPQTLWLWKDGRIVLRSLANTGIAAAPTPAGTWPVYLRYRSQTMEGTTPSGAYYRDPDVPWVSYFYRGDAVHGFPRARYGFPQSLGCVELPVAAAAKVWNNTAIGTLVTVGSGTLAGG